MLFTREKVGGSLLSPKTGLLSQIFRVPSPFNAEEECVVEKY